MHVEVIDITSGTRKTMPKRYADILVKLKRARWPDEPELRGTYMTRDMSAGNPMLEPALKKRGPKPKTDTQE